jgi:sugar/nucleoside kinase (ribokinase family)
MDLWINIDRDQLMEVIGKCDMLTLNESEARLLTGRDSLSDAADCLLDAGPAFVLIKKGESGSMLVSPENTFLMPAYKLDSFKDPTGAGDTFAGGLMGALAESGGTDEDAIRRAMVFGSVAASFGVEEFGVERLAVLDREQIRERCAAFRARCGLSA